MQHFKMLFQRVIGIILISGSDSETDKVKKIVWYTFTGGIILMFLIAWVFFVVFTFSEKNLKVPQINGCDQYDAMQKLFEKKLIANPIPIYTDNYPFGTVFDQTPKAGEPVKKGRVIHFSISLGPEENALGDYRGDNYLQAIDIINLRYPGENKPFKIDPPVFEFSDTVAKWNIISQNPPENTLFRSVDRLQFVVSNGPQIQGSVTLDDFNGKKFSDIIPVLESYEIKFTFEYTLTDNRNADNIINSQSIGKGALISDLISTNKVLILNINKYHSINNNRIKGTTMVEIPSISVRDKLRIDYVLFQNTVTVLEFMSKGGIIIPVPFNGNKDGIYKIYLGDNLIKTIVVADEIAALEETD